MLNVMIVDDDLRLEQAGSGAAGLFRTDLGALVGEADGGIQGLEGSRSSESGRGSARRAYARHERHEVGAIWRNVKVRRQ